MANRDQIRNHLVKRLSSEARLLALWEGGSTAFGRNDEYSDLDLIGVVERGATDDIFVKADLALQEWGPVSHSYRLPEPAWHDYSQKLYQLAGAPPYFFVDFVLIPDNKPIHFELERHGPPQVFFDRGQHSVPAPFDRDSFHQKRLRRVEELRGLFPFYVSIVFKEIKRNHPIDAFSFYCNRLVASLVEVWGMKFRPDRYDYGLRYLEQDLPKREYEFIKGACFVGSTEELKTKTNEVVKAFQSAIQELNSD